MGLQTEQVYWPCSLALCSKHSTRRRISLSLVSQLRCSPVSRADIALIQPLRECIMAPLTLWSLNQAVLLVTPSVRFSARRQPRRRWS